MIKHKTVSEDKETPSHRMVFYFLSTVCDPPTVLFMGRDKHENEDLIKHGWPGDVWFHVDKVTGDDDSEGELRFSVTGFNQRFQ